MGHYFAHARRDMGIESRALCVINGSCVKDDIAWMRKALNRRRSEGTRMRKARSARCASAEGIDPAIRKGFGSRRMRHAGCTILRRNFV
jgi:hypothetical protein